MENGSFAQSRKEQKIDPEMQTPILESFYLVWDFCIKI